MLQNDSATTGKKYLQKTGKPERHWGLVELVSNRDEV
jgi:hypothetical protein